MRKNICTVLQRSYLIVLTFSFLFEHKPGVEIKPEKSDEKYAERSKAQLFREKGGDKKDDSADAENDSSHGMRFLPDPFALKRPGRSDAEGVVGTDLRHVISGCQEKNAKSQRSYQLDFHRIAENDGIGTPVYDEAEEDNQYLKDLVRLCVLLIILSARIDLRDKKEEKQHQKRKGGEEYRRVFSGIAVYCSVKRPVGGHGIRHQGKKTEMRGKGQRAEDK